jgi:hypothetical protein
MDKQTADEVLSVWGDLVRTQPGAPDLYNRLSRSVRSLLPHSGESAGVALVENIPTVLAVAGMRVFTAHVVAGGDESSHVVVRSLPLDPERVVVEVIDNAHGTLPDGSEAHARTWTFSWPDGRILEFVAVLQRYKACDEGHDFGEAVAVSIAKQLGWAIPEPTR